MPAEIPEKLLDLVTRFTDNLQSYKSGHYKEAELRKEFIDPMFKLLGWDVDNESHCAEQYKDVIHEDAIKVGGATKAPDYCFRIGGTRKFFLEAKKPSIKIKEEVEPAYQLRRYAWSAKLPLGILTDFEEFAVYDCRIKPNVGDKADRARILYVYYTEYAKRWREIAAVFSKDAVLRGSFDRYAEKETHKGKKGTAEVDEAFLDEIERWRETLAKNIAQRNPKLNPSELNHALLRLIDRLLFLRMCEDRDIEPYGKLQGLVNSADIYPRLCQLFRDADQRYNSGLFHFREEKDRATPPDAWTLDLEVDDGVLRDIIRGLYYPESPYEFSVLPTEILGQVYEQFLGKVIRLTAGHRAVVEEKPEVKKAGGVYYTPTWVVDYIVRTTLGPQLEGKTPAVASKIRVLDPACGSGSFLLGAYQFLLDWHRDRYLETKEKNNKLLYRGAGGAWYLTTAERKRILLTHIFGVDIDSQAVETTKLSLLLKVLEGESGDSLARQMKLFKERALPDLDHNIQCGNALVGPEFHHHSGQQTAMFDEEDHLRVNAFDWRAAFPEIAKTGGWDVVIGNPPYIRIQNLKEWQPKEVDFFKTRYKAAGKGNYDIYVLFVEKGLEILSKKGCLGFILPHKFFNSQYGEPLRQLLSKGKHLSQVVHFGDKQVFSGATTYTCLLFLDKAGTKKFKFIKVEDLHSWKNSGLCAKATISASDLSNNEWNLSIGENRGLFEKLHKMPVKLGSVASRMAQGIRTSANEVYVLDHVASSTRNLIIAHSKYLDCDVKLERESVRSFLQGREIRPYCVIPSGKWVVVPYALEGGRVRLLAEKEIKSNTPNAFSYLCDCKKYLQEREKGRMRGKDWYAYIYPKNIEIMSTPKILIPDIANRASFALDENGEFAFTSGYGITLKTDMALSVKYTLGLLNSKVLDFYLKHISTTIRGGFFRYFTQFIEQLPIRVIDFADKTDKSRHDKMVELVEQMLELNKRLLELKAPKEIAVMQNRIAATDKQIDALVYELYGLTDEEIRLVEEQT